MRLTAVTVRVTHNMNDCSALKGMLKASGSYKWLEIIAHGCGMQPGSNRQCEPKMKGKQVSILKERKRKAEKSSKYRNNKTKTGVDIYCK